jgi:hypothetical protein
MTEFDDEERAPASEEARSARKDDIKFVMDSEQGRRVVWSLLEKGQVFGPAST